MERTFLSTAPLADHEKFEVWREECMLRVMGISVEHAGREAFAGTLSVAASQSLVKVQMNMQAGPYHLRRTESEISRVGVSVQELLLAEPRSSIRPLNTARSRTLPTALVSTVFPPSIVRSRAASVVHRATLLLGIT